MITSGALGDQFDNSANVVEAKRLQRLGRILILPFCAAAFVFAVLFLPGFPLASIVQTPGGNLLPYLLVALGLIPAGIVLGMPLNAVSTVSVNDDGFTATYARGKVVVQRWDDPRLSVKLFRAVVDQYGNPIQVPYRALESRGLTDIRIAESIAATLIERAKRRGLFVTLENRTFPERSQLVLEVTQITPARDR
ncbi:MAG TPA: hypothetical protein VN819_02760 [Thermoplasmata archaeon]|nr:hypothetical protein [Thermoplasmata archaeon]